MPYDIGGGYIDVYVYKKVCIYFYIVAKCLNLVFSEAYYFHILSIHNKILHFTFPALSRALTHETKNSISGSLVMTYSGKHWARKSTLKQFAVDAAVVVGSF